MIKRSIAVLSLIALIAGCTSSSGGKKPGTVSSPATSTTASIASIVISGKVVLGNGNIITDNGTGTACWAYGNAPALVAHTTPFDDVKEGAQIVVTSTTGETLALGTLGAGVAAGTSAADYTCEFPFTVSSVPGGQTFYGIKVAGQPAKQIPGNDVTDVQIDIG